MEAGGLDRSTLPFRQQRRKSLTPNFTPFAAPWGPSERAASRGGGTQFSRIQQLQPTEPQVAEQAQGRGTERLQTRGNEVSTRWAPAYKGTDLMNRLTGQVHVSAGGESGSYSKANYRGEGAGH